MACQSLQLRVPDRLQNGRRVCGFRDLTSRQSRLRVAMNARRRGQKWWQDSWEGPPLLDDEVLTVFGMDGTITNYPPVSPFYTPSIPAPLDALPSPADHGLCIGSIFTISATNGVDATRRMNVLGFCQSVEMLYERVEYTVVKRGGEIMIAKRELKSGFHETLTIALALPLLWGVPPEHERLKSGIESGGGIIDRIYKEWFIMGNLN